MDVFRRQAGVRLAIGSRDGHVNNAIVQRGHRSWNRSGRSRRWQHDMQIVVVIHRNRGHDTRRESGRLLLRFRVVFGITDRNCGDGGRHNFWSVLLQDPIWLIQWRRGIIGGLIRRRTDRRCPRRAIPRNATITLRSQFSCIR